MFDIAIVDADSLLYRAALGGQTTLYSVGDKQFPDRSYAEVYASEDEEVTKTIVPTGNMEDMINQYVEMVAEITKQTKAKHTVCYTGSIDGNFRHQLATIKPYKGNRSSSEPPLFLSKLKSELLTKGKILNASSGMEADDEVIIQYILKEDEGLNPILCTIDKDSQQFYGYHYNYNSKDTYAIDEAESYRNLYTQLLTGDSTDNIPGLFGVGGKSKLVKDLSGMKEEQLMFNHVYTQYIKRFGAHASMFCRENFCLLYMNRVQDTHDGDSKFTRLLKAYE